MAAPNTAYSVPTRAPLREEDLRPGKAWVHPDTRLEYEDYHAFFVGDKPLSHWRNNRILGLLVRAKEGMCTKEAAAQAIDEVFRHYSRDGFPGSQRLARAAR